MKCPICTHGETAAGTTTVTLERGGATIVFKEVPADVCENCGEAYVEDEAAGRIFEAANQAAESGVQVDVRAYEPASA